MAAAANTVAAAARVLAVAPGVVLADKVRTPGVVAEVDKERFAGRRRVEWVAIGVFAVMVRGTCRETKVRVRATAAR